MQAITKFLILVVFLSVVACATKRPEGKTEAEVLFKEAQTYREEKRYLLALEKLNLIKSQHPYSFYATHAELLQADILFEQENFAEASAAYILFRDFHPKHEKVEYVTARIGESFFMQIPDDIDRDLSAAYETLKYYSELLERYPGSEYAQGAREKINDCKQRLENKERYVADFYFKTKVYDAARYRYRDIIKNIRREDILNHSIVRVVESSQKNGDNQICVEDAGKFRHLLEDSFQEKFDSIVEDCKSKL